MTVLGIDVSKWQDSNVTVQKMDFTKAKAKGAKFVFLRASIGLSIDEDYKDNLLAAKAAGLMVGAYHYLNWLTPAQTQANYFKTIVGEVDLPLVLDFECREGVPALSKVQSELASFLNVIGSNAIIYTSPSFWVQYGTTETKWAKYPLWIAHYGVISPTVPKPFPKWTFWQYSATGPGKEYGAESTYIDLDYFNGTEQELFQFAGLPTSPTLEERVAELEKRVSRLESFHN